MSLITITGLAFAACATLALLDGVAGSDSLDPLGSSGVQNATAPATERAIDWKTVSLFTLQGETLDGERLAFSSLTGRVLLVVNVASACGYTRQYGDLQALHERFAERGLTVIGVPSNEFGNQEPGTPEQIRDFCTSRFGVTFPLMAKAIVKPGDEQHPIFRALVARTDEAPKWNFTKYLVARDGVRAAAFPSRVSPSDEAFIEAVEKLLDETVPSPGTPGKPVENGPAADGASGD